VRDIHFSIREERGLARQNQPLSIGIPCAPGELFEVAHPLSTSISSCLSALSRWPDGSVRWLLCEALVSLAPRGELTVELGRTGNTQSHDFKVSFPRSDILQIESGKASFRLTSGFSLRDRLSEVIIDNPFYLRAKVRGMLPEDLACTLNFTLYKQASLLECEVVFHNPAAASHRGGFWARGPLSF
jgi:hypothetical protein